MALTFSPFPLFDLVLTDSKIFPRPAWWGPSVSSPSTGRADRHQAGTLQPRTTDPWLPSGLPALLTSTWSDFVSLFDSLKFCCIQAWPPCGTSLCGQSPSCQRRRVLLWVEGGEGTRRPISIQREWEVGAPCSGSFCGHHPLELRKSPLAPLLPLTIRPCLARQKASVSLAQGLPSKDAGGLPQTRGHTPLLPQLHGPAVLLPAPGQGPMFPPPSHGLWPLLGYLHPAVPWGHHTSGCVCLAGGRDMAGWFPASCSAHNNQLPLGLLWAQAHPPHLWCSPSLPGHGLSNNRAAGTDSVGGAKEETGGRNDLFFLCLKCSFWVSPSSSSNTCGSLSQGHSQHLHNEGPWGIWEPQLLEGAVLSQLTVESSPPQLESPALLHSHCWAIWEVRVFTSSPDVLSSMRTLLFLLGTGATDAEMMRRNYGKG